MTYGGKLDRSLDVPGHLECLVDLKWLSTKKDFSEFVQRHNCRMGQEAKRNMRQRFHNLCQYVGPEAHGK